MRETSTLVSLILYHSFCDSYTTVKIGLKWGFIDKQGIEVVPLQYYYACEYRNGFVRVMKDNKCGYISQENLLLLS
ncbi:MAG: WG repeat-containing protein [Alistipes sp.]|nr:WG repeat-containing protein [Alistipes sp.]